MSLQQHPLNRTIAVFIDFENLALGFKDRLGRFEIKLVLKRLLEKGKIVAKKAYCDWSRFGSYTALLHESAVELIEIPKRSQTGKNSADIRLCVDAMDLAYSKDHIDTFVIVSGDSDFSPLVSKLKELGKHVIGFGMIDSTSALLRDNCDEFIYYEDLLPSAVAQATVPLPTSLSDARRNAFNLLFEALTALRREDKEVLGAAMIKNTICRMHPGFNESQFGYKSFSALLQDAAKENLLELSLHQKAGTWMVDRFGEEVRASTPKPSQSTQAPAQSSAQSSAQSAAQATTPITSSSPSVVVAQTPSPWPAPARSPIKIHQRQSSSRRQPAEPMQEQKSDVPSEATPQAVQPESNALSASTVSDSLVATANPESSTKPPRPRGGRGRRKPANKTKA